MVNAFTVLIGTMFGPIARFFGNAPLSRSITYAQNEVSPNLKTDIQTLVEQRWRGIIPEDNFLIEMQRQGVNKERSLQLFNTFQNLLTPGELVNLKRRELLAPDSFDVFMKRHKFTKESIDLFEKATEFLPGPNDLIRFAVREVFNPDIVTRFELDADFPEEFAKQGLKIGIQPETASNFWRAHWELPSIRLGLEMFHRLRPKFNPENPVDDDDIDTLLRVQDVMPFWQPRIKEISFLLPTRVDLRRMYVSGLVNRDEVKDVYEQLGYPERWAEKLTQLAESLKTDTEINLTKTLILDAFKVNEIDGDAAKGFLQTIAFSEPEADLIIAVEQRKIDNKLVNKIIDIQADSFVKGFIDEEELSGLLDKLDIVATRRDLIIADALIDKEKKKKVFSKSDVRLMLKTGAMEFKEAQTMLVKNGYEEEAAERLLGAWGKAKLEEGVELSA